MTLTLKAAEHIPAAIQVYQGKTIQKTTMSTTFGDPPVDRFLLAGGDFDFVPRACDGNNPFMSTMIGTCVSYAVSLPAARLKSIINESFSPDTVASAVVLAVLKNDAES